MSPSTGPEPELRYARGTAIAAIVVAASWHVVNDLPGTVLGWGFYAWPPVVAAAWVVMAGLVVAGSVVLLRSRTDRGPALLPVVGLPVLLLCVLAVLFAVRAGDDPDVSTGGGVFSPYNWAWSAYGWFAMVLLWRWPVRWLVASVAVNSVVVFLAVLDTGTADRLVVSRYVITIYGTVALQLAVVLGARALQRSARRATVDRTERAELDAVRLAADEVHADRARRYREIGKAVRHLLAGLARGELDPADPDVQRQASIGAARLRRLIAEHDDAPDPLVHELRACADMAERRDVAVTLETAGTVPDLPLRVRRALTEAPMHLLAAARTHARVTVISAADTGEVEVSVVADGDGAPEMDEVTTDDGVEVIWSTEGGSQWVRARWHGP